MSALDCEAVATRNLRDWLLLKLPAKVAEVNLLRAAVLRAPWAGPFNVGAGKTLGLNLTAAGSTFINVPLTQGTARTATQIAADINAVTGLVGTAAVDSLDRWYVTSGTAPSASGDSKVELRGTTATDANQVFGFEKGGAKVLRTALLAPYSSEVYDRWPKTPVFTTTAPAGARMACVIGERKSKPVAGGPRIDQHHVTTDLTILRMEPSGDSQESIQAAVRCVRECLLQDLGRTLNGTVQLVEETSGFIAARSISFTKKDYHLLYDAAVLNLSIRVHARPAAT